jgi:hypothetical protein
MGVAVPIVMAAATAYGAYSQYKQGQYQSAVARNNQSIAEQNANLITQQGAVAEQTQRQKTAQLIGMERANEGASGVSLDSGSPLRLQSDTATLGEVDALTIRNNAAIAAWGARSQASSFGSQAKADALTGELNAGGSLLSGAAATGSAWDKYRMSTQKQPATGT